MPNNKTKILAIDPGVRQMGIAFLDGGKLLYHGVKVIPKRLSARETLREGKAAVLRLMNDFKPNLVVLEKSLFADNSTSGLLNVLEEAIKRLCRRRGVRVICIAPNTLKKAICGNGRASKRQVSRAVVARFPELKVYLKQNRKWKESYHGNMFDAVALGMMVGRAGNPISG
jgi:crossover junction endodeoxyribonuclease RuvC